MTVPQPPSDVYNAVHPVAAQYGVPDPIWETVAYVESGYNPSNVGDAGTSFGLFQLHEGGQLRTSPSSVMGTAGERQNALEAMPAIGGAWSALKSTFNPNDITWWQNFGAQSGHPGGSPGEPATMHLADVMMKDYQGSFPDLGSYNTPTDQQDNSPWSNIGIVLGDVTDPKWWARIGIILIGGVIIVFGAIKLIK